MVADDGACSLREAVIAANTNTASGAASGECPAGDGADTIILYAANFSLTLSGAGDAATGDLDITEDLSIQGEGAWATIINASAMSDRVFDVAFGDPLIQVTISGVTVTGGSNSTHNGGGILNAGILTLQNTTVTGNSGAEGGGIYNYSGALTIENSTISNNSVISGSPGGGIVNDNGTLIANNSTISGNEASFNGGGIFQFGGATFLNNVTITDNTAAIDGSGEGGGIYANGGDFHIKNNEAESLYRQALERAEQLGDQRAQAQSQIAIGELLRKRGQYAEAAQWLDRARALKR